MNNSHSNWGFTLLELLVGILIFSVVVLSLFSSFNAFVSSSHTITRDVTRSESIKYALSRLTADVQNIFVIQTSRYGKLKPDSNPDAYGIFGRQISLGGGEQAALEFSSLCHIESGTQIQKDIARISYYVEEDETGKLNLYRFDVLHAEIRDIAPCPVPVLCKDIKKFEILYFNADNDEFSIWDSDSEDYGYAFPARMVFKIYYMVDGRTRLMETGVGIHSGRRAIK